MPIGLPTRARALAAGVSALCTVALPVSAADASAPAAAPVAAPTAVAADVSTAATGVKPVPAAGGVAAAPTARRTTPQAAGRFIVKYRDPNQGRDKALAAGKRAGLTVNADRKLATGATLVTAATELDATKSQALRKALAADPGVEYVEPDRLLQPSATPPDPQATAQWHYKVPSVERAGLNLPPAWDLARGGGVTVAVLDTGITAHTDLMPNRVNGYDFISDTFVARDGDGRDASAADPGDYAGAGECGVGSPAYGSSWHGTHVAGTVGAAWGNGVGGVGVAHYAKIQPVRVLGRCGGYTSDIVDGIVWAAGGTVAGVPANATPAKVINMSLGGSGACSATEQQAINAAVGRGTTVVVAAGNENSDARTTSPASCNNVVTVAALGRGGSRAYYSNYGPAVDVAAPGGDQSTGTANGVLSTLNTGTTVPGGQTMAYYQGTSMAAPHVAGVAALIQTRRTTSLLSPAQVETALKNNVRPIPGTCAVGCGRGLVDAYKTVVSTQRYYPVR